MFCVKNNKKEVYKMSVKMLRMAVEQYELEHGTLSISLSDQSTVNTGCTAGCAGDCQGDCRASCADSCYNRCKGSYSN